MHPFNDWLELTYNMICQGAARAGFSVRVTVKLARQCPHWPGHSPIVPEGEEEAGLVMMASNISNQATSEVGEEVAMSVDTLVLCSQPA